MKKYLILILVFWISVLLQQSFFCHFTVAGTSLNLVLMVVVILNFFREEKVFTGFLAGAILDIFSSLPFGTFFLTLGVLSFLIKKLARLFQKSSIFSLLIIFAFSLFFYKFVSGSVGGLLSFISSFSLPLFLLELVFNFAFLTLFFFLQKYYGFFSKKEKSK